VTLPAQPEHGGDWGDLAPYVYAMAVARALPEHAAGPRPGRYDPSTCVYNLRAENTHRARAALASARAGVGLFRATYLGDSLTAGASSVRGTSDPTTFLRGELSRAGHVVGELLHSFISGGSTPEPRLSYEAGSFALPWATIPQGTPGTATGTGSVFEIVTSTDSGPFTVAVDGGATTLRTPSGGAAAVQVFTVTGLTQAGHTATVTATTAVGVKVYAAGFRPATGIVLEAAGMSGARTTEWLAAQAFGPRWSLFHAANVDHDLVQIELGVNDRRQFTSVVTFRENLLELVEAAGARGATVALALSNEPADVLDVPWSEFAAAVYDVADDADVPLLDLTARLGPFATANADGLTRDLLADTVHLTPAGNAAKARGWLDVLAVV